MYKGRLRLRDKELKQIEAALPLEILISIYCLAIALPSHRYNTRAQSRRAR
eukprot:SAG25_NODE_4702_length_765_cov_1.138138_1_plen_51_part_00